MKRAFLFFLLVFIFFYGCNNDTRESKSNLISAQELITVPPDTMKNILDSKHIPHGEYVFGYKAYKILYETTDDAGNKVTASGLLTVPVPPDNLKGKEYYSFPVVLNHHGTIFLDNEAPSYNFSPGENSTFPVISLFTGIYGFATAMPDYIGYGASKEHYHPYLIYNSTANASVDMLKASIDFCEKNGIPIRRDAFLTGYSEGGYATMATAKKLQEHPEILINVKAVAPLDGVYDLETMGLGIATKPTMIYPAFIGFLVYSYTETYPKDVVRNHLVQEPYASRLLSLFDGNHSGTEINANLTTDTNAFFNGAYLLDFVSNSENPFRKKLKENSTDNWAPLFPVRIVHCEHDNIIPYMLAFSSYNKMVALGGKDIQIVDPEDVFSGLVDNDGWNHQECAPYAYQIAAKWFCELVHGAGKCK